VVPTEGCDSVALLETDLSKRLSKRARPEIEVTVVGAHAISLRTSRYYFDCWEELPGSLKKRDERQREIHHCSAHECLGREVYTIAQM
jgi:hypothetical protein